MASFRPVDDGTFIEAPIVLTSSGDMVTACIAGFENISTKILWGLWVFYLSSD
jgi:hypothetical protein